MINGNLMPYGPEVPSYAYAGRADIRSVRVPDEVRAVGEGAFFHCTNLTEIYVGRGLRQIGAQAFFQIGAFPDIVWMSGTPYRSMVIRILPPYEKIRAICAPYMPFTGRPFDEKTVLSIGFILHPELEAEFEDNKKDAYVSFIRDELTADPSAFARRRCIVDVIRSLFERNSLFHISRETFLMLLAHARSYRTDLAEKKILDGIEAALPIRDDMASADGKKLIRSIYALTSEEEMRAVLDRAGLSLFPDVLLKKNGAQGEDLPAENGAAGETKAPAEVLKLILSRYMAQVTSSGGQQAFRIDPEADAFAELIDPDSLRRALTKTSGLVSSGTDGALKLEGDAFLYPVRLVPYLRYADSSDLIRLFRERERLLSKAGGSSGFYAAGLIEKAALLNDDREAVIFAGTAGHLAEYAEIHGLSAKECFWDAFSFLETERRPELSQYLKMYADMVYDCFLDGSALRGDTFVKERLPHPGVCRILDGLLFFSEDTGYFALKDGLPSGLSGETVPIPDDAQIVLAEPSSLSAEELSRWTEYVRDNKAVRTASDIRTDGDREDARDGGGADMQALYDRAVQGRWKDQLYATDAFIRPSLYDEWKGRYLDLVVTDAQLTSLPGRRMKLSGGLMGEIRILFCGKHILTAQVCGDEIGKSNASLSNGGGYRLSELMMTDLAPRRLHEMIHLLDEAFRYPLLLAGRIAAEPYLTRMSFGELQEVLAASVKCGHHENAAALLKETEKRRTAAFDGENTVSGCADSDLQW